MADPDPISQLIKELRLAAGRSGTEEILALLRNLPVYTVSGLPDPQPMFFEDAWQEMFDRLIAEAAKV